MNKIIYFILPLLAFTAVSCDDDKLPEVTPSARGTVTDNEGNVYEWVKIGNLLWTTSNANNGPDIWDFTFYNRHEWVPVFSNSYGRVPQSSKDYINDTYRPVYGNLMNYETAVASAPEGWRLPSDEDWQNLERCLGMTDTGKKGLRGNGQAFRLQEKGNGTELGMLPGGGILFEPSYGSIYMSLLVEEVYGFYWTSTIEPSYIDEKTAYYRKFLVGNGSVWRECSSAQQFMSVRWVKDAE
ncbi:MAG: fibrobacter succinogenes major paralogous domain-containing protein [Muribaculaceae bacterium]|nr:fibrobacter succinogenes major paralogous domain-containing protein [Muribaculaceae bacterium]